MNEDWKENDNLLPRKKTVKRGLNENSFNHCLINVGCLDRPDGCLLVFCPTGWVTHDRRGSSRNQKRVKIFVPMSQRDT